MAGELTIACSAEYDNDGELDPLVLSVEEEDTIRTVTTQIALKTIQSVATSEEALLLGDVSTRCVCMLINLDTTNYIEVKVATGGAIFAKLWPRGTGVGLNFCLLALGSGAQSPFVIANTAACRMAILLLSQ